MEYKCEYCNKLYKSYQSKWNHINRYHSNNIIDTIEEQKGIINITCDKCNFKCSDVKLLKEHNKTDCRPSVNSNNIYKFKADTLGKNKYKGLNGGDIYIIQTEFNLKGYYKIGISTNLYKRLQQYRCGAVLEPKLHYYYPCKNINDADKVLKDKLTKFNIKREIYKTDNLSDIREIIKTIQLKMNSDILEIEPETKECEIQSCNFCDVCFTNSIDLNIHKKEKHFDKLNTNNLQNYNQDDMYNCKHCNKTYKHIQSRWKHEKKCKDTTDKIDKMLKELEEIKKENKIIKQESYELIKIINQIKENNPELNLFT